MKAVRRRHPARGGTSCGALTLFPVHRLDFWPMYVGQQSPQTSFQFSSNLFTSQVNLAGFLARLIMNFKPKGSLPSTSIYQVPPSLYTSWGRTMGAASRSLSGFLHPDLSGLRHDWEYERAGEVVRDKLALIRDKITDRQRSVHIIAQ